MAPASNKEAAMTRFFTSIIVGDIDAVRGMLPDHPDALFWLSPAGYPPLHMAILNRRDDLAVLFAEHGADLSQEACGETVASLADRKGLLERLEKAAAEGPRRHRESAERCGEDMRSGLPRSISVSRRQLQSRK